MNDYDVGAIFQEIEIELIKSMRRNLADHKAWESDEGFKWEQWQAKKIREIRKFRAKNKAIMNSYNRKLGIATRVDLLKQYLEGGRKVDKEVSRVIEKGYSLVKGTPSNDFFQGDNDKLDKLINAIHNDFKEAQNAALRQMDDVYRKTIFKTEVYLGSGATTVDKAIDMATKEFLSKGINCITYKDGRNVNIASYAQMAVRTANKRVFLMGEGERRKEWGLSLVLVSQYMQCSPLCLPWQGKVFIDDVYSDGKADDGPYPLLSTAITGNLFHPNCRHTMSTFFEGINEEPEPMRKSEIGKAYEKAQREAEINRNIQKYKRLKAGSQDPVNIAKYSAKVKEWQDRLLDIENKGNGDIINILPNADHAVIPERKFTQYALNPMKAPDKAKAFQEALGYNLNNVNELMDNIYDNINKYNSIDKGANEHGHRYEILMTLIGANGKTANIKTGWIVDNKTNETRLTSAYVTSKKRRIVDDN